MAQPLREPRDFDAYYKAFFKDIKDNMPYNTTAIPPRGEATGTTQLPLSRIKKIIQVTPEVNACSNAAAFAITIATEMFIQSMAQQAHNVVKSEKKPRRNIQYRDLSNAVAHNDNLEFLSDIVPKTMTFGEAKELAKKKSAAAGPGKTNGESSVEAGQTTLDGKKPIVNGTNGFGSHDAAPAIVDDEDAGDPNDQLAMEIQGARMSSGSAGVNGNGEGSSRDVEMH